MKVNQVYSLLSNINQQMFGDKAIAVEDLTGIISMGKTVLSTDENKDLFLGVLADRIGTTILRTLDLELEFPNLLRNSYEWGCIISKINIQPFTAKQQKAWNVGDNDFTPNNFAIDKPVVTQTFFTDANAWEYDVTIPDTMLKTAFTNAQAFGAFIDGIMSAMSDSMTIDLNNMSYACINNFVAEKMVAGNGIIDVLAGYNTQAGKTYGSLQEASDDKEFYRYVAVVMRNIIKHMGRPSKLYNTGGMVRATARDNMNILVNSSFWSGFEAYLSADTFHDEMVRLDGFREFVTLQATGTTIPTIANDTEIHVKTSSVAEGQSTGTEVSAVGIIAILTDREAMGIGYDDRFTAVDRNNRNRYTNYTSGATVQYFNDLSENGVILCAVGSSLSLDKTTLTFANSSADAQTVTATVKPTGSTVTWKSSDEEVATVSGGVVSPEGAGTCTITASITVQGVTTTKTVAVTVGSEAKSTRSK